MRGVGVCFGHFYLPFSPVWGAETFRGYGLVSSHPYWLSGLALWRREGVNFSQVETDLFWGEGDVPIFEADCVDQPCRIALIKPLFALLLIR